MPNVFDFVRQNEKKEFHVPDIERMEEIEGKSPIFEEAKKSSLFQEPKESLREKTARQTSRTGVRGLESIATLPGRILEAPVNVGEYVYEKVTGKQIPGIDYARKAMRTFAGLGGLKSREELKEFTTELSKGYLEPKSAGEELADTITEDAIDLMIPVKGKIPFFRSILTAIGATGVEKGAEKLGTKKETARDLKMASTLLLSLQGRNGRKGVEKFKDNLYSQAEGFLPQNAFVVAAPLSNEITQLQQKLSLGGTAPSKTATMTKINEIQQAIQGGNIPVRQLTNFKKTINELRGSLYKQADLDRPGRRMAKANLDELSGIIDKSLRQYERFNPQWGKYYFAGNEAHKVLAESRQISGFVAHNLKPFAAHGTVGLLLEGMLVSPGAAAITATGGLGVAGLIKAAEIGARVAKKSALRTYYWEVLKDAALQDTVAFQKHVKQLNDAMEKDDEIQKILKKYEKPSD